MGEFDRSIKANLDWALEETCRELPHHGGDHETRKYIPEHLIEAARSGRTTLEELRAVAHWALLSLMRQRSA